MHDNADYDKSEMIQTYRTSMLLLLAAHEAFETTADKFYEAFPLGEDGPLFEPPAIPELEERVWAELGKLAVFERKQAAKERRACHAT